MAILATFTGLIGLGSVADIFNGLYGMDLISDSYASAGWTIEGLISAGMAFVV